MESHTDIADVFARIYRENIWGSAESRSGPGSTKARAADFLDDVVALLRRRQVRSVVDAGCGDFSWAGVVADVVDRYIGVEVVPELVERHQREQLRPGARFMCADFSSADLPEADLILSRDSLVHLSFADIDRALANFERSGATYLLTTTFIERDRNDDIVTGDWRPLNLQAAPFHWPEPIDLVDERCTHTGGIYRDKRIGLWPLAQLTCRYPPLPCQSS